MKFYKITENLPANKFDHQALLEELIAGLSLAYKDISLQVDRDVQGNPIIIVVGVPDNVSLASISQILANHNPVESEKEKQTKKAQDIKDYFSIEKIKELEARIEALEAKGK